MKPTITRCPHCGQKRRRSNPANARYWLLLHMMADQIKPAGLTYSPETWHHYFKTRYLGCDEVKMPNGKTMQLPRSTADMSTEDFSEYMMKVEHFANERGVYLDMEAA